MSFQAYLDNIEDKTGLTPGQLVELAHRGLRRLHQGRADPGVAQQDHDLGRGHGMALVHVITRGPDIGTEHVGTTGSHCDESSTLWLDGKSTRPS